MILKACSTLLYISWVNQNYLGVNSKSSFLIKLFPLKSFWDSVFMFHTPEKSSSNYQSSSLRYSEKFYCMVLMKNLITKNYATVLPNVLVKFIAKNCQCVHQVDLNWSHKIRLISLFSLTGRVRSKNKIKFWLKLLSLITRVKFKSYFHLKDSLEVLIVNVNTFHL